MSTGMSKCLVLDKTKSVKRYYIKQVKGNTIVKSYQNYSRYLKKKDETSILVR